MFASFLPMAPQVKIHSEWTNLGLENTQKEIEEREHNNRKGLMETKNVAIKYNMSVNRTYG